MFPLFNSNLKEAILKEIASRKKDLEQEYKNKEEVLNKKQALIDQFYLSSKSEILLRPRNFIEDMRPLEEALKHEIEDLVTISIVPKILESGSNFKITSEISESLITQSAKKIEDRLSTLYLKSILPIYLNPESLTSYLKERLRIKIFKLSFMISSKTNLSPVKPVASHKEIYELVRELLSG